MCEVPEKWSPGCRPCSRAQVLLCSPLQLSLQCPPAHGCEYADFQRWRLREVERGVWKGPLGFQPLKADGISSFLPPWALPPRPRQVGRRDAARWKDAQILGESLRGLPCDPASRPLPPLHGPPHRPSSFPDGGQLVGPSLGREGPLSHRARRQRVRHRELRAGRLGPCGHGGHGAPLRPWHGARPAAGRAPGGRYRSAPPRPSREAPGRRRAPGV